MRIIYLSDDEENALRLLAQGIPPRSIRAQCSIPLAGFAVFMADIRRKTGIRDTKYPLECRNYIAKYEAAIASANPTQDQIWLMRSFTQGGTLEGMTYQWNTLHYGAEPITPLELLCLVDNAFDHIGIFSKDDRARRMQFRFYIVTYRPQNTPETPLQWEILRHVADGLHITEISRLVKQPEAYVQFKLREACLRVGLIAKGRDVQRNLIRAYLLKNDPLNDPLF